MNKSRTSTICEPWQMGKSSKLPSFTSLSNTVAPLDRYTVIFGDHHLLYRIKVSNIMLFWLMITPGLLGCILLKLSLISSKSLLPFKNKLKTSSVTRSKPFRVMVVVNSPVFSSENTLRLMEFTIRFQSPQRLSKMVLLSENIATSLNWLWP